MSIALLSQKIKSYRFPLRFNSANGITTAFEQKLLPLFKKKVSYLSYVLANKRKPKSLGSLSPSSAFIPNSPTSIASAAQTILHGHLFSKSPESADSKALLTSLKGAGSRCGTSSCCWPFWSAPSPVSLCTGPAGLGWGPSRPFSRPARLAPPVGRQRRGSAARYWKVLTAKCH